MTISKVSNGRYNCINSSDFEASDFQDHKSSASGYTTPDEDDFIASDSSSSDTSDDSDSGMSTCSTATDIETDSNGSNGATDMFSETIPKKQKMGRNNLLRKNNKRSGRDKGVAEAASTREVCENI